LLHVLVKSAATDGCGQIQGALLLDQLCRASQEN
jgi:hypothetical protein